MGILAQHLELAYFQNFRIDSYQLRQHRIHYGRYFQTTVSTSVVHVYSRENTKLQQTNRQLQTDLNNKDTQIELLQKDLKAKDTFIKQLEQKLEQKTVEERKIKSHERQKAWKLKGAIQVAEVLASKLLNDIRYKFTRIQIKLCFLK